MHTLSSLEGTFTAGPCIHLCLPNGRATIFMKGTRKDISLISNAFRHDSSGGTLDNLRPLATACVGMLPRISAALQVLQIHTIKASIKTFRTRGGNFHLKVGGAKSSGNAGDPMLGVGGSRIYKGGGGIK